MPGMDGDELAVKIRDMHTPDPLLLVAVTAMSSSTANHRIKEAGFHLHLVKPVDPFKLLAVVDALFRLGTPEAVIEEIREFSEAHDF